MLTRCLEHDLVVGTDGLGKRTQRSGRRVDAVAATHCSLTLTKDRDLRDALMVLAAELNDHRTAAIADDGSAGLSADVLMTSASPGCSATR